MSFDKLDYVIAVAQEQNLTKAAARLYISQPALTSALNKLESELGVKLFDRKHSPIRLTAAGNLYIQEMNHIRQLQIKMQNQLSSLSKTRFCLSIGSGRGHYWLPLLLPTFAKLHPDVQLSINNNALNTHDKNIDNLPATLAIGTFSLSNTHNNIQDEFLIQENLIYVIPQSLGLISPEKYKGCSIEHPCLIDSSILDGAPFVCGENINNYTYFLEREMNRYQFKYGNLITYGTPQAALLLASNGMGVTFISQNICRWEQIASRYDVYFCTLDSTPPVQNIHAFYAETPNNVNLIQDMLDLIRKQLIPQLYPL